MRRRRRFVDACRLTVKTWQSISPLDSSPLNIRRFPSRWPGRPDACKWSDRHRRSESGRCCRQSQNGNHTSAYETSEGVRVTPAQVKGIRKERRFTLKCGQSGRSTGWRGQLAGLMFHSFQSSTNRLCSDVSGDCRWPRCWSCRRSRCIVSSTVSFVASPWRSSQQPTTVPVLPTPPQQWTYTG